MTDRKDPIPDFDFDLPDFGGEDFNFDVADFDYETPEGGEIRANETISRPRLYRPTRQVKYDRAEEMADQVGEAILAGHRIDALLSGNFIFGDIFEAMADRFGIVIENLTISTLSLSEDNIESFANLIEFEHLKSLDLIVSAYFFAHNRPLVPMMFDKLSAIPFTLAVAGTHTKVALMKTSGGRKIVFHGSANLRSSRSVEIMTVEADDTLYDFHMSWHRRIIEHFPVRKGAKIGAGASRAAQLFATLTED